LKRWAGRSLTCIIHLESIVAIVEAPNDEAIASVLFATGSLDNARTKTLKAFPMSEAANIIKNFP